MVARRGRARSRSRAAGWGIAAYALGLAAIALWPVPIDSGVRGPLADLTGMFPFLTYPIIERGANVVLFVPLGLLLASWLRHPWLALPVAVCVSVAMEVAQLVFLPARTPSIVDVAANTAGAVIGMGVFALGAGVRADRRTSAPG